MRNCESSSAGALESIVIVTGYWNAYKLDIPMQCAMAMAMVVMNSERKPPLMLPSLDETHSIIGDFTETTVSNSGIDLHLVQVTSTRLDGRMLDIPGVEIWRTGVTLDVPSFFFLLFWLLLYLITSWISAQYKWHRHGFLPPPETSQVEV
jgi:hypothetical protein